MAYFSVMVFSTILDYNDYQASGLNLTKHLPGFNTPSPTGLLTPAKTQRLPISYDAKETMKSEVRLTKIRCKYCG
jgi:hypothetical protein